MRTDSYIMTAHTGSAGDMLELENLRKAIKIINKSSPQKFYIKCQGRGPRAVMAIADGKYPRAYDQSLPLKYSLKMDVYLYKRGH